MVVGIEKFNRTGIFSTIRYLENISGNKEYGELLGFTQTELENNFEKFMYKNENESIYNPSCVIASLKNNDPNSHFKYLRNSNDNTIGIYTCINQGDVDFLEAKRYEVFVDKSEMLIYTNCLLEHEGKYICISRPRRFGKTISANMVAAYYDNNCDAEKTFADLKITQHSSFLECANKYIVIKITISDYLSKTYDIDRLIDELKNDVINDLRMQYGYDHPSEDLNKLMHSINCNTGYKFVVIIDEWDCILREFKNKKYWQRKYLDFLRYWFKDKEYLALVYMTGILPIKKYGTHSALNMFKEYSMLGASQFTEFVGFTEPEVKTLCQQFNRDFNDCKMWYDGYQIKNFGSIYNPRSVNQYISSGDLDTYWNKTETYKALCDYIFIEKYGLRDIIINLLANDSVHINPNTFTNDMETFKSHDDVLTLLVHLGYLTYDVKTSSVRIPNKEIASEFITAVNNYQGWPIVVQAINNSAKLLFSVLRFDCEAVALGVQKAHFETSILQYNDENALSYVISLAFYAAREKDSIVVTAHTP